MSDVRCPSCGWVDQPDNGKCYNCGAVIEEPSIIQVNIARKDGTPVLDINEMELALKGSIFTLDRVTTDIDGVPMVQINDPEEDARITDLIENDEELEELKWVLPSGYVVEADLP